MWCACSAGECLGRASLKRLTRGSNVEIDHRSTQGIYELGGAQGALSVEHGVAGKSHPGLHNRQNDDLDFILDVHNACLEHNPEAGKLLEST